MELNWITFCRGRQLCPTSETLRRICSTAVPSASILMKSLNLIQFKLLSAISQIQSQIHRQLELNQNQSIVGIFENDVKMTWKWHKNDIINWIEIVMNYELIIGNFYPIANSSAIKIESNSIHWPSVLKWRKNDTKMT